MRVLLLMSLVGVVTGCGGDECDINPQPLGVANTATPPMSFSPSDVYDGMFGHYEGEFDDQGRRADLWIDVDAGNDFWLNSPEKKKCDAEYWFEPELHIQVDNEALQLREPRSWIAVRSLTDARLHEDAFVAEDDIEVPTDDALSTTLTDPMLRIASMQGNGSIWTIELAWYSGPVPEPGEPATGTTEPIKTFNVSKVE
jgi:hypothetical protein